MLHEAVTLDAAMTAQEALRRLAQHGYWTDSNQPAARRRAEEYVEEMRRLLATPGGEEQTAPDGPERHVRGGGRDRPTPATDETQLTIDLRTLDLPTTLRILARPVAEGWAAIRRQDGITIFWYSRRATELINALIEVPANLTLLAALDLHEWGSVPTIQVGMLDGGGADEFTGVVLYGHDVAGVADGTGSSPPGRGRPVGPSGERGVERDLRTEAERGIEEKGDREHLGPPDASRPDEVRAYPLLETEKRVSVGQRFNFTIGLSNVPMANTDANAPMVLRGHGGTETIGVEVQVLADGFDAPAGWRHSLVVTVADPGAARVVVPLVPRPQDEPTRLTSIIVYYLVEGVNCGSAACPVVVEQTAGQTSPADNRGQSWLTTHAPLPGLTLASPAGRPDIEVDIAKPDGNPAKGDYLCTLRNAHGISEPLAPLPIRLGADAKTFAKMIINDMQFGDLAKHFINGHSAVIKAKLPKEFWTLLEAVAAVVKDRPLTLQLNSAEPYVPWELALVDPPLDPNRPKILAAQLVMGRWILGDSEIAAPPRSEVAVKAMAVMAGMYNVTTGLRRLPKAEEEATDLEKMVPAINCDCSAGVLGSLLDAEVGGGVQAVHFAGHGRVDPTRPGEAALYLNNGTPLSPILFHHSRLGRNHAPFIFLNACMVGTAGEILGDYGGFPGHCLAGGFSALVAPLWAVNDTVAKWIAIEFYKQALASPTPRPVAEVLRDLRANYQGDQPVSSYLAYVYYGNPYLRLTHGGAPAAPVPADLPLHPTRQGQADA